jgi:3-carboxy-cis,cis-muconate cycloisomerase
MAEVEQEWLRALVRHGVAPTEADVALPALQGGDVEEVALAAEAGGTPVVPFLALLRKRLGDTPAASWLHRGLTSQDVVDTALVLAGRDTTETLLTDLDRATAVLRDLVDRHRGSVMAGRTLTQHAVPITFGLKAAQWLQGVLDARDELRALRFPVQVGGAAGTRAAVVELGGDPDDLVATLAGALGLDDALPWHTTRTPLTRYADALVRTTDALGHIAADVLLLSRPEIGELAEPAAPGRGGSSTMPHKANPVLSVLVRRAALSTPGLAAQLHLAAATAVDERPDGAWHTEWSTLATLSRRTLVAASQSAELLAGLRVDTDRMTRTVDAHRDALLAERDSIRGAVGHDAAPEPGRDDPGDYLGAADRFVDEALRRAGEEVAE